jgi:hypothetical protein
MVILTKLIICCKIIAFYLIYGVLFITELIDMIRIDDNQSTNAEIRNFSGVERGRLQVTIQLIRQSIVSLGNTQYVYYGQLRVCRAYTQQTSVWAIIQIPAHLRTSPAVVLQKYHFRA